MSIVIRRESGPWQKVAKFEFGNEKELQDLLHSSPELLNDGESAPAVFIREAGLPGSGSTDLIGVDADGGVQIVETKLARNPEIRRKVIGQVLEYAAFLWRMSFEELNQKFLDQLGKPLLELLQAKTPERAQEQVRSAISATLATGSFELLIVVDEINPELEKIIAYLAATGSGLRLKALELEVYKQGSLEMVVPHKHGDLVMPPSRPRTKTIDEVFDSCPDAESREVLSGICSTWKELGGTIVPGTVGLSFRALIPPEEEAIFWGYPASLQAGFGRLHEPAGAPEQFVQQYREAVSKITGFDPAKTKSQSYPVARLTSLGYGGAKKFVCATMDFVERWRNSGSIAVDASGSLAPR